MNTLELHLLRILTEELNYHARRYDTSKYLNKNAEKICSDFYELVCELDDTIEIDYYDDIDTIYRITTALCKDDIVDALKLKEKTEKQKQLKKL